MFSDSGKLLKACFLVKFFCCISLFFFVVVLFCFFFEFFVVVVFDPFFRGQNVLKIVFFPVQFFCHQQIIFCIGLIFIISIIRDDRLNFQQFFFHELLILIIFCLEIAADSLNKRLKFSIGSSIGWRLIKDIRTTKFRSKMSGNADLIIFGVEGVATHLIILVYGIFGLINHLLIL